MANHKSALKRAKQSEVRRLRNKAYKTGLKTAVKQVREAVESGSSDQAAATLKSAVSLIQKTAVKGVIHRKKAARKVSRLARRVNQIKPS